MLLTSGLNEKSDDFKEAYEGKCLAWESYFKDITEIDHNKSLTATQVNKPNSQTA